MIKPLSPGRLAGSSATPATVRSRIYNKASLNKVSDVVGSPNCLLYTR